MKKLLKLCSIGGMALVIAACGNGEEETDTADEAATEETETEEGADGSASEEETETEGSESNDDAGSETESETGTEEEDADSGTESGDDTGSDNESESSTEADGGTSSTEEEGTEETETDDSGAENSGEADAGEDAATGEEQSKTFVLEEEGFVNELVYYYIGDEVQRQTSESDITYEALGVENEEQARELLEQQSPDYEGVDGVEHSAEYGGEGVIETLEVDYTVADISEVSNLEGSEFDEEAEEAQFISMEESEEQLLNAGYELAEDE